MSEERIGEFRVGYQSLNFGGRDVELAMIPDLEQYLDRERLLSDSNYEPPYWSLVWSGAQLFLPGFFSRHGMADVDLLDVGCGLGVVGVAAAVAGARVTAIDREVMPLEFLARSCSRNDVEVETHAIELAAFAPERTFDHVIGAELLYERDSFPQLAADLLDRLRPTGRLTIVDAHRVDTSGFYESLHARGARIVYSEKIEVREEKTLVRIDVAEFAVSVGCS
ncbi:MAG: methyltransferase [Candidatus Binatia bacterium]|nr:methyltransferase [Candidatus Binatia bacterium]MDG2009006.1 methyltransferase [Candidatus Binatia bacterium]